MRLPSFSGGIALAPVDSKHDMWRGFPDGAVFHAWWPGQFDVDKDDNIEILAVYGEPGHDAFITDLPVLPDMNWEFWESRYGINLQPKWIIGEPAVIETRFGAGKVLLSYLHFETPGDEDGHAVLLNLLQHLAGVEPGVRPGVSPDVEPGAEPGAKLGGDTVAGNVGESERSGIDDTDSNLMREAIALVGNIMADADGFIDFGIDNFLWYRRNYWILQWRRGVRGVEYSTLRAMLGKLAKSMQTLDGIDEDTVIKLRRLHDISRPFFEEARLLLLLERDAIGEGPISPLKSSDKQILALRKKLFSVSKRCGGLYKEIIDLADEILLPMLRAELDRRRLPDA